MIKFIISDMDGTLFAGHGKTVFDLTERNRAAMKKVQEYGIEFCVASGRMIDYGIKLMERYGFEKVRAAGFNGAVCYDCGRIVVSRPVNYELLRKIIPMVQEKFPQAETIQIQGLGSERIFTRPDHPAVEHYQKDIARMGIGVICPFTVDEFLSDDHGVLPGKLSIIMPTRRECIQVIEKIKKIAGDECSIAMSGERLIEVGSREAGKDIFVAYLRETYHLHKKEIAVIGDALNDAGMYRQAGLRFAMESGDEAVKRMADVVVRDVAECIDYCIACNLGILD